MTLATTAWAQDLPALVGAAAVSGSSTSAVFRAGASTDGITYRNEFSSSETISITSQIAVEAAHINQVGKLFVLIELDGQFYMRGADGAFSLWDLDPANLVASVEDAALPALTEIPIVENLSLGSLGLAGRKLSVYLAYNLNSAAEELYYSSSPLQVSIASYDPLSIESSNLQTLDTSMLDNSRDREIPLLIFLPESLAAAPVILFSHGLGGSRETAVYLGEHWSARGYLTVFMQHAGSDSGILDGVPAAQLLSALQAAASAENVIARIADVSAVIDQLEVWNSDGSHSLNQRMNLDRLGMSGHSFGARTTQTTSGEIVPWLSYSTRDPRIKAAMPLSGSVTDIATAAELLADVDIPWLVMTGSNDVSVVNDTTVEDRLAVFPALPVGSKYELVLFEGEHHAFTDRPLSAIQNPRNPAHHPAIMALSTAFWDSTLRDDQSAMQWLEGDDVRSVLAAEDSWQFK